MNKKIRTNVHLTFQQKMQLKMLAEKQDITAAELLRRLVTRGLKQESRKSR